MTRLSLSAIGRDRPGIVAAVSRVLLEHGLNIEDSQMTILGGQFTMTLIVAGPDSLDLSALEADLQAARLELGLEAIAVSEVHSDPQAAVPAPTHIVSVYGADHPGIVAAVSQALAEANVNITDLNTRLVPGDGGDALYVMMMEVDVPGGVSVDEVNDRLDAVAAGQGVEVSIRPLEADVL